MSGSKRTRFVLLIAVVVAAFAGTVVITGSGPMSAVDRAAPPLSAHGHARSAHAHDIALTQPAGGPSWGSHVIEHSPGGVPNEGVVNGSRGALYRTGEIASEPTLGLTSGGTILYQLWDAEGLSVVGRSTDGGRTWSYASPSPLTDATGGTFDPYLYVDPVTDRVFSVNLTPALECHEVSFSDDAGVTWTSSPLCGQLDHQTLFAGPPVTSDLDPDVYPNVVYLCSAQVPPGANFSSLTTCQRSLDGGRTFVPTGEPAYVGIDPEVDQGDFGIPGFCGGLSGHGVVGPDGTVYLPRTYCGRPFLAISRDEGATWERVQVSDIGTYRGGVIMVPPFFGGESPLPISTSVAIDEAGTLYFAWVARDRLPYVAISEDGGLTWGEPMMIAPPGVRETIFVDVAAAGPGEVAFAYMG
ncbi:MAG: glycoside hydrolase, partial [Actinobacteria bacterium]|nr:glycoside hydrolase [Actinomycetota bacterium]